MLNINVANVAIYICSTWLCYRKIFIDLIQMVISCEPVVLSQLAILETKRCYSISLLFSVPLGIKAIVKITCNNSNI